MGKRSKNAEGVETIEAVTDNTSTGAVETPEVKTITAEHIGAEVVSNRSPGGPVVMSASWHNAVEGKVVTPADSGEVQTSATAETK